MSLVFPVKPNNLSARLAIEGEIVKLQGKGLDVSVYIHTGDKLNPVTWNQVRAPNGKYMVAEYVASSGETVPLWDWLGLSA